MADISQANPVLLQKVRDLNKLRNRTWLNIALKSPAVMSDVDRGMPIAQAVKAHFPDIAKPDNTDLLRAKAEAVNNAARAREAIAKRTSPPDPLQIDPLLQVCIDNYFRTLQARMGAAASSYGSFIDAKQKFTLGLMDNLRGNATAVFGTVGADAKGLRAMVDTLNPQGLEDYQSVFADEAFKRVLTAGNAADLVELKGALELAWHRAGQKGDLMELLAQSSDSNARGFATAVETTLAGLSPQQTAMLETNQEVALLAQKDMKLGGTLNFDFEEAMREIKKGYDVLKGGGSEEESVNAMVGEDAENPDDKKVMDNYDQLLSQMIPEDAPQALWPARDALLASPEMKQFMAKYGVSEPRRALQMLRKKLRQDKFEDRMKDARGEERFLGEKPSTAAQLTGEPPGPIVATASFSFDDVLKNAPKYTFGYDFDEATGEDTLLVRDPVGNVVELTEDQIGKVFGADLVSVDEALDNYDGLKAQLYKQAAGKPAPQLPEPAPKAPATTKKPLITGVPTAKAAATNILAGINNPIQGIKALGSMLKDRKEAKPSAAVKEPSVAAEEPVPMLAGKKKKKGTPVSEEVKWNLLKELGHPYLGDLQKVT